MPVTTNTRKLAALLGASGAGIGTDGLLQAAAVDANIATQAELDAAEFDDNKIQTNLVQDKKNEIRNQHLPYRFSPQSGRKICSCM